MSEETTQHLVEFNERKKLYSYYMLDEIELFFEEISQISEQYEYITAAERRAFNLAAWYLTDISKLVSNSGMLLQYKKLSEYYRKHSRFPRVLVVDDLMMHGRGMSKFLEQLETLVRNDLGYDTWSDYDQMSCRRSFTDSIDIYVYAKNRMPILLDSRYTWQMHVRKKMYLSELRDLSLQLSDFLSYNNVANTSFVPTFFSQTLSKILEKKPWSNGPNNQFNIENETLKWFGIRWNYLDEDMLIFLGFYGQQHTNRISTIRFFPSRKKRSDRFISFSILPDLPKSQFDELCQQVGNVLVQYRLEFLSSILREKDPILQTNKGQLLNYIISVIDYLDFQYAAKKQWNNKNESDENKLFVDVGKIAINFGLQAECKRELIDIIQKTSLRQKLKEVINSELDKTSKENALLDFIPAEAQLTTQPDNFAKFNQVIEQIIYNCGAKSEKKAVYLLQRSYDFVPSEYQNYSVSSPDNYGYDGILSFHDIIKQINPAETENGCIKSCILHYLSAYIALMDNGILSTRLQFTSGTDKKLVTILKAGELSTFSAPRSIAVFIPAFAKVSYYGTRFGLTQQEAISRFYRKYYDSVNGAPHGYQDICKKMFTNMCNSGCWIPTWENIIEITNKIYNCGQTYTGWNFKNMTWQTEENAIKFQETLIKEADMFISRDDKYWE